MTAIRVEALRSMREVAPLSVEIDALNLASRRPCPHATYDFMDAYVARGEGRCRDGELLFLAAFDESRLVGYLPLRKHTGHAFGVPYGRVELLVLHDTDRPHVVARKEDEARCCEAFYRHLFEQERGWSFLELAMQDEESGLVTPPPLDPRRYYVRRFENRPNTTVPLTAPSFGEYYRHLGGAHRRNVGRLGRRLLAAGKVEVVACSDPRARLPLLDLYVDLERRSWQGAAHGLERDPRRLEFFRALCAPEQPLAIGFDLVFLDDLLVAGMIRGAFAGQLYALQMAFDRDYEDLAPGHLLALMAIHGAYERGQRSVNFEGGYAYYKARLGGVVTATSAVQIYRIPSVPWLRARAGEWRRRFGAHEEEAKDFNPERRRTEPKEHAEAEEATREATPRPARTEERELARATLQRLESEGVALTRLAGASLERALPFTARREAA